MILLRLCQPLRRRLSLQWSCLGDSTATIRMGMLLIKVFLNSIIHNSIINRPTTASSPLHQELTPAAYLLPLGSSCSSTNLISTRPSPTFPTSSAQAATTRATSTTTTPPRTFCPRRHRILTHDERLTRTPGDRVQSLDRRDNARRGTTTTVLATIPRAMRGSNLIMSSDRGIIMHLVLKITV